MWQVSIGNFFKVRFITAINGESVIIKLKDSVVFTNYMGLKKEITKYADKNIALDFAEVTYIDHSVKNHLVGLKRDFETKGLSFERVNTDALKPINEHHLAEEIAV